MEVAKTNRKVAYFNRELSWLAFNRRVLELAKSLRQPLLERLKFLAIVSSNLDEFFEIRVSGLLQQVEQGVVEAGIDGLGPREQLRRINDIAASLVADQYDCWREQLVPALRKEGLRFKQIDELDTEELDWLRQYFEQQVFPVLTPMGIDPAHPFPQLTNKALYLLVQLEDPEQEEHGTRMAVIPVPRILPRLVEIQITGRKERCFIWLSDLCKMFDERLFPGFPIKGAWAFRITRNSDLYIDEEEVDNLLKTIEEGLYKLRKGAPVRLEIEASVDESILNQLLDNIKLANDQVYQVDGPINLMRLMSVYGMVERPDLCDATFEPNVPLALMRHQNLFDSIRNEDFLLHHPYDAFDPVVSLIRKAADDPQVFAIKQTLYRTSGDSPIIGALKQASLNGKQVTALVEIKARFDEANNIQWARELEEVGVHVVYGLVGLKTHCKCLLIVRREGEALRRYVHLGTGNYNPKTARLYTDLSYFTSREDITAEVAALFNTLTGFSRSPQFQKLLVAPFTLHSSMQALIKREAANAHAGKPARIIAKCNSLIEKETIDNLYEASQAGVTIELVIRGICALVPGVKGMSENIRVISIVGRFLEHSRIYWFQNAGGEPELYAGSGDWMQRNFFRRIECIFPIENPTLRSRAEALLEEQLRDETATELSSNGAYLPVAPKAKKPFDSQQHAIDSAIKARKKNEKLLHE